ncbi:TPA: DNA polymerase III subunit alpha [Klebsiella pneumoniae]|nr:DNA polymerase III subunit alpha [Klebsiella pneumoniae]
MKALMVRTDFSLGESALKASRVVAVAKELGYSAIISADTMNLASIIPLQQSAGDDMAVICGVRLVISDNPFYEAAVRKAKEEGTEIPVCKLGRPYSFTALIKNDEGYKDLCELMTLGNRREQFHFFPRISLEQLAETYSKGNILLLTSDRDSIFHRQDFVKILTTLLAAGGRDNFYSVVYPIPTPLYDQLNMKAMKVANALKIAPVAFYPAYYEKEEDADLRDIAHMVINNIKTDQPYRFHIPHQRDNSIQNRKHLLVRLMEFSKRMGVEGISSAMVNETQDEIIAACSWRWHEMPVSLPVMAEDEGDTLTRMAAEGLKRRLTTLEFGWKPPAEQYPVYINRLRYELSVLKKLGFCGYFLMVENLLSWARKQDIPVGPGRGSSAGSLVAWAIGITNIDPLRHGLLFERFINPERLDLPDADLDFSQAQRPRVLEYLEEHYGEKYVAGIPNFSYLGMASALRDTARIYGVSTEDMAVSKQLKPFDDEGLTLEETREQLGALDKYAKANPEAFDAACKLQSLMRSYGKHAAGVIVSGVPLTERTPVELRNGVRCIAFDKRFCESMGLIKLDVLGLATLDLLALAKRYIKENEGIDVNLDAIPLDDKRVLEGMALGETTGVFQFESGGMRNLLKNLGSGIKPMSFEMAVATTALYRPGPMQSGMMDTYVSVARGYEDAHSLHPSLDELTKETNGVLVYQEQIMKASQILAGFSLSEADMVRKAIGKKDIEKMKKIGADFSDRAQLGWLEVQTDDGQIVTVHRAALHPCSDGKKRTIEQAMEDDADIIEFDTSK